MTKGKEEKKKKKKIVSVFYRLIKEQNHFH